jgi:hypothetical protein
MHSTRVLARAGRVVVAVVALCGIPAVAAAAATGSAASPDVVHPSVARHLVPSVLAGLAAATFEGPAPAAQVLTIGVSVARPDTAGENSLYAQLYNPSSPLYHHFLTTKQFAARFGVSSADSSGCASSPRHRTGTSPW